MQRLFEVSQGKSELRYSGWTARDLHALTGQGGHDNNKSEKDGGRRRNVLL